MYRHDKSTHCLPVVMYKMQQKKWRHLSLVGAIWRSWNQANMEYLIANFGISLKMIGSIVYISHGIISKI